MPAERHSAGIFFICIPPIILCGAELGWTREARHQVAGSCQGSRGSPRPARL